MTTTAIFATRLLAAIAETEKIARNAHGDTWTPSHYHAITSADGEEVVAIGDSGGGVYDVQTAQHIALHDPQRELRCCAADRRTVEQWLAEAENPYAGLSDDELHERRSHPAYEYATTEGQRKAWDYSNVPPDGDGWERNATARNPEAWERFDYTEESYWRRLDPDGPHPWTRTVPFYIENLADSYGLKAEA